MAEKWTGVDMLDVVHRLVAVAIDYDDETAVEELIDMREMGVIPKSAVNYVIHKFSILATVAKRELRAV